MRRISLVHTTILIIFLATIGIVNVPRASAAQLRNRSVRLSTSVPTVFATLAFTFEFTEPNPVSSIAFEFCQNSPLFDEPCDPPSGLDATGVVIENQTGETGFSVHSSTNANEIVISRPLTAVQPGPVEYIFNNIMNPATPNSSYYVRITAHTSGDGTGPAVDWGAVALSTSGGLGVQAFVPPYLVFCVGVTVSVNCDSIAGNYLSLGVLSPDEVAAAASQMAAYTNDETGYNISALGTTMTSGNNVIPALSTAQPSTPGNGQFGINLRANTAPEVGEEPDGGGTGFPTVAYNTTNTYTFNSGDIIASSTLPTEPNKYTVSYIVNIPESQPTGVYTTTLTYVAVAQF